MFLWNQFLVKHAFQSGDIFSIYWRDMSPGCKSSNEMDFRDTWEISHILSFNHSMYVFNLTTKKLWMCSYTCCAEAKKRGHIDLFLSDVMVFLLIPALLASI